MNKQWGFDYITEQMMDEANPGYDPKSGKLYEIADPETFSSKSSDFMEACKEFDEFIIGMDIWDVDPEASFNYGEEYRSIIGILKNYINF